MFWLGLLLGCWVAGRGGVIWLLAFVLVLVVAVSGVSFRVAYFDPPGDGLDAGYVFLFPLGALGSAGGIIFMGVGVLSRMGLWG